jgi:hypothetical protein
MQSVTCKQVDQLFEEHGIDKYEEQFIIEALAVLSFIAKGRIPVGQALSAVVDDKVLYEKMRTFMYPIRLRMMVIALAGSKDLSEEEAQDLHKYLRELATAPK